MTGRKLSAEEALRFNLVNKVSKTQDSVVPEAVEMAKLVAGLSPDAIICTRAGLREAWEQGSVERAVTLTEQRYSDALRNGENVKIGLAAFAQKKQPKWVAAKL